MRLILRSAFWLTAAYIVLAPAPERAQATAALVAGAEGFGLARSAGCIAPVCAIGAAGLGVLLSPTPITSPSPPPTVDPMHDSSTEPAPVPRPRPAWMG